jgi:predicted aminopeptidase
MTVDVLDRRLREERIIPMPAAEWAELAPRLDVVECHATALAGELVIVRTGEALAAVEEPSADTRIVRRLADSAEAQQFVRRRLETYDKMWDGCGCKVDYYD